MEGYHKRLNVADDVQRLAQLGERQSWQHDLDFTRQLVWLNKTVLVTDTGLNIVYASSNLLHMNGYSPEEVIGRKPSMFQGRDTSPDAKSFIRQSLDRQVPFCIDILNYRKNGESYMCGIEEYPLFDEHRTLVNFIAFEWLA